MADAPQYECVIGFNYEPKGRKPVRVDAGGRVPKLPAAVIEQLLEGGELREVSANG
jgi:hypothetical protein